MKKLKKSSIVFFGILLFLPMLGQNVFGDSNNYYSIGGHTIPLEKLSYVIWNVTESSNFEIEIYDDDYMLNDVSVGVNDKFKLSIYNGFYSPDMSNMEEPCLCGKLEYYNSIQSTWYQTYFDTKSFLVYNSTTGDFYTAISEWDEDGYVKKFLLLLLPMTIDLDDYANTTLTKSQTNLYDNYTTTSNSINFTHSISGLYNTMALRNDGIVNRWTYENPSPSDGSKIIAEYESHGLIESSGSIPFGNEYIAIITISIIGLIIIVKRKSVIKR